MDRTEINPGHHDNEADDQPPEQTRPGGNMRGRNYSFGPFDRARSSTFG